MVGRVSHGRSRNTDSLYEAVLLGDRPDAFVVVAREAKIANVKAIWKQRQKDFNQPKRQILVEQRFHATDPSRRRSRSAANAR